MTFLSALRHWLIETRNSNHKKHKKRDATSKQKKVDSVDSNPEIYVPSTMSGSSEYTRQTVSHKYEGNRRFQDMENVEYFLPNDNEEVDRLHQQHWVIKALMDGNYQAPIKNKLEEGITVLDSGCGPGTWGLEMSEEYPNSTFYGIDATPVFPCNVKPKNCHFELANVADKLPYPDNYFDYVHQRLLVFGLTRAGWKQAISEIIRVLKPGGYLEFSECDGFFNPYGPKLKRLMDPLAKMINAKDMVHEIGRELGPNFLEPRDDLEDIKRIQAQFPINHHGKLGELYWDELRQGFDGTHSHIIKECPDLENLEIYKHYLDDCAQECKEYETYAPWSCYTARKKG